jgi:hypothetical protein
MLKPGGRKEPGQGEGSMKIETRDQRSEVSGRAVVCLLLLALFLAVVGLSGCATTESENVSERPWNTPKSWENGLPSSMTEGR